MKVSGSCKFKDYVILFSENNSPFVKSLNDFYVVKNDTYFFLLKSTTGKLALGAYRLDALTSPKFSTFTKFIPRVSELLIDREYNTNCHE